LATRPGLKRDCLSFWEVAAQSVANIAPVATPTLIIPLVFASGGNGTWVAYFLATLAMLLMAFEINQFARRSSSAGSLYAFVFQGLGPTAGVICGWSLVIAYIFTGGAVLAGGTNYVMVLAHYFVSPRFDLQIALCGMILILGVSWYFAYRDIQLSTRAMLFLEFTAMLLIVILAVAFLLRSGKLIDPAQVKLTGASPSGIRLAEILAVFSFVGFESSTALGVEAKNPLHTIPRSVWLSVLIVGGFFTFMSYVMVMAFQGHPVPLDKSNAPFTVIAELAHMPGFGVAIAIGAVMSQLGCGLASVNAASRVIYAMGRHGLLPSSAGAAHREHSTPYVAVSISSLIILIIPATMLLRGTPVLDIFGYLGSVATFGFLIAYIFIAVAGPIYLRRRGELKIRTILISLLALFLLLMPLVGSVYPPPEPPSNYLPYIFMAMLGIGTVWFLFLRARKPHLISQMAEHMSANEAPVCRPISRENAGE
jgi:amino acid transporter